MTTFPVAGVSPVSHIQAISSDEVALATIATRFERDYSFPPLKTRVHFLANASALEQALLDAGYDATFARNASLRMRAVALHRRVLINSEPMATSSWMGRVGTLAHELVHSVQYELAGGRRGTSEQWLREGFAEWIALDLLQTLEAFSPGAARRYLEDELAATRRTAAPRLDQMRTFRQWVDLAGRTDIAPHVQAVLIVDLLIDRHGIPAILDYFRRFSTREDPEGNFSAAFGVSRSEFQREAERQFGPG